MTNIKEHKQQAKQLGIPWDVVQDTYRELKRMQKEHCHYDWAIREWVWSRYAYSPECRSFWRHGLQRRFSMAFTDGDRTMIPRFDEAADGITDVYPEFNTDDPAETLFDYLKTGYHRIPSADDTYTEAIQHCLDNVREWEADVDFPFGDEPF